MGRPLGPAWLLASTLLACGGPVPMARERPPAPASPAGAASAVEPTAAAPREIRVVLEHRFVTAVASIDLPLLDFEVVRRAVGARGSARLASVDKLARALLGERREVAQAWGELEHCTAFAAVGPSPRSCVREDRRVSDLNGRYARDTLSAEDAIDRARDELPADAGGALGRAWLDDLHAQIVHDTAVTAPGELDADTLDATFELGASVSSDASGAAYLEVVAQVPTSDASGVLSRERAAVAALEAGDPARAVLVLEQARSVARGAELTEVLFLLGQAHARRFPDGTAEAERALEEALASPPSARVLPTAIARSLMLAAYRASDPSRALAVGVDLDAGRIGDPPPPPPPPAKGAKGALSPKAKLADAVARQRLEIASSLAGAIRAPLDGTSTDLSRIEADAIERLGVERVDWTTMPPEVESTLRATLALRALYVGDAARAEALLAGARPPAQRGAAWSEAVRALCRRGASLDGIPCAPEDAPPRPRDARRAPPATVEQEIRAGALEAGDPLERRAFALARLCVEPAWEALPPVKAKSAPPPVELAVAIQPGTPARVSVDAPDGPPALAHVAACLRELAASRFEGVTQPVVLRVDVTRASTPSAPTSLLDDLSSRAGPLDPAR